MDARDTPHLPEEILAVIISLTSPRDACRFAIVSRAFHAAADSDAVWSCFLPGDLPPSVDVGELKEPSSKKEQFMRLSDEPALLLDGLTSTWLDRATGGKCYALPARALDICLGDDPNSWRWVHADVFHDIKTGKRISAEVAQLLSVDWLEIRGKIPGKMLSPNSIYAAYIVFKLTDGGGYGLDYPFLETSVSFGGSISTTREACLHGYDEDGVDGVITPKQVDILQQIYGTRGDDRQMSLIQDGVLLPWERADGWMELELGWFYNKGDGDDEVRAALKETTFLHSKSGLIVRSIEIRIFFF